MTKKEIDVIIIGGGPAGMSAALWCDELGLDSVLLESGSELGGQLLATFNEIKNHLGADAKNGSELRDQFLEQIKTRNFTLNLSSRITDIDLGAKEVSLRDGQSYKGKSIVVATGVSRRSLGIEGEKEFQGKGILASGNRDKEFVKNKIALIVGGGDAAFENTQILSETAEKVILVHRRKEFSARDEFVSAAKNNPKVEILSESILTSISGKDHLEEVSVKNINANESKSLKVDGVLVRIGVKPNSELFGDNLKTTESGYIKVDDTCETSLPGIFAIGDVANAQAPTISSAIGMGATAIKNINLHLIGA